MGSPLGAAKYNSLLQDAASLDRLGTTAFLDRCFHCSGLQKMVQRMESRFIYKKRKKVKTTFIDLFKKR